MKPARACNPTMIKRTRISRGAASARDSDSTALMPMTTPANAPTAVHQRDGLVSRVQAKARQAVTKLQTTAACTGGKDLITINDTTPPATLPNTISSLSIEVAFCSRFCMGAANDCVTNESGDRSHLKRMIAEMNLRLSC